VEQRLKEKLDPAVKMQERKQVKGKRL